MIHLELTEQETDYVFRLLMSRPMGEVETLVNRLRSQVQHPAEGPSGPLGRPNGAGDGELLPALP